MPWVTKLREALEATVEWAVLGRCAGWGMPLETVVVGWHRADRGRAAVLWTKVERRWKAFLAAAIESVSVIWDWACGCTGNPVYRLSASTGASCAVFHALDARGDGNQLVLG